MLILHGLDVWHWALGGVSLGVITLTLLFITNKRLGISGGFENVCSLASQLPYFRKQSLKKSSPWRLTFLTGLIVGGALSSILGGGWEPTWDLGRFDSSIGWGPLGKMAWMLVGGLFIGLGTRIADGCTSGHGIFGVANFERASWKSMFSFMATGIVTTHIIYNVIF